MYLHIAPEARRKVQNKTIHHYAFPRNLKTLRLFLECSFFFKVICLKFLLSISGRDCCCCVREHRVRNGGKQTRYQSHGWFFYNVQRIKAWYLVFYILIINIPDSSDTCYVTTHHTKPGWWFVTLVLGLFVFTGIYYFTLFNVGPDDVKVLSHLKRSILSMC